MAEISSLPFSTGQKRSCLELLVQKGTLVVCHQSGNRLAPNKRTQHGSRQGARFSLEVSYA